MDTLIWTVGSEKCVCFGSIDVVVRVGMHSDVWKGRKMRDENEMVPETKKGTVKAGFNNRISQLLRKREER